MRGICRRRRVVCRMEEQSAAAQLVVFAEDRLRTPRLRRFMLEVLSFLGQQGASAESAVRLALGNQPDVSKALRCLLRRRLVTRTGLGGRARPFMYAVASSAQDARHGRKRGDHPEQA